jgi:hypothetical protein
MPARVDGPHPRSRRVLSEEEILDAALIFWTRGPERRVPVRDRRRGRCGAQRGRPVWNPIHYGRHLFDHGLNLPITLPGEMTTPAGMVRTRICRQLRLHLRPLDIRPPGRVSVPPPRPIGAHELAGAVPEAS